MTYNVLSGTLSLYTTTTTARLIRPTSDSHTERPQFHLSSQPGHSVFSVAVTSVHSLQPLVITANTHYGSGALIPECNDLSQFQDTGEPSIPVQEFNHSPVKLKTPLSGLDLNTGQ